MARCSTRVTARCNASTDGRPANATGLQVISYPAAPLAAGEPRVQPIIISASRPVALSKAIADRHAGQQFQRTRVSTVPITAFAMPGSADRGQSNLGEIHGDLLLV